MNEIQNMSLKVAPSASAAGATWLGLGLPDWVLITAIIYTCLQIGLLLWDRIIKPCYRKRKGDCPVEAQAPKE